jgi:hypothetical protein
MLFEGLVVDRRLLVAFFAGARLLVVRVPKVKPLVQILLPVYTVLAAGQFLKVLIVIPAVRVVVLVRPVIVAGLKILLNLKYGVHLQLGLEHLLQLQRGHLQQLQRLYHLK